MSVGLYQNSFWRCKWVGIRSVWKRFNGLRINMFEQDYAGLRDEHD
jgi:hypothetical protein